MRENRTHGLEGGESGLTGPPYPYLEQSDDSFSNRARSISLIVMAIVFTLFISVTSSAADRVQNGLLVRYDFNEGGGNSIHFDMR